MMSESSESITRRDLRTPRAAAYAGFIFSILLSISIVLVLTSIPSAPPYDADWLSQYTSRVSLAVGLVPFAGIAFLWFIGVIRDQVGALEDQFFSSVFFGSGLLFLGGLFVWMTIIAAVLASYAASPESWTDSNAYIFGRAMIKVMGGVVTLRMAGVFMFSSGTIWLRTKVLPRWLVWLTFAFALILLIGGPSLRWLRLAFPIWVFVVSIFLLRARPSHEIIEENDETTDEQGRDPAEDQASGNGVA